MASRHQMYYAKKSTPAIECSALKDDDPVKLEANEARKKLPGIGKALDTARGMMHDIRKHGGNDKQIAALKKVVAKVKE